MLPPNALGWDEFENDKLPFHLRDDGVQCDLQGIEIVPFQHCERQTQEQIDLFLKDRNMVVVRLG